MCAEQWFADTETSYDRVAASFAEQVRGAPVLLGVPPQVFASPSQVRGAVDGSLAKAAG